MINVKGGKVNFSKTSSEQEKEQNNKALEDLFFNNPNFMNLAYHPYVKSSQNFIKYFTKIYLFLDSNQDHHQKLVRTLHFH